MGFPIVVRWHLYIESAPCSLSWPLPKQVLIYHHSIVLLKYVNYLIMYIMAIDPHTLPSKIMCGMSFENWVWSVFYCFHYSVLSVILLWGGWGCEVSCGGHHRPRGKTTAKRKDHHGVSSGWSSVWHRSNSGLSSTQYEQIPIILGVWPFWLTPFVFRSITFWQAYG